MDARRLSSKAVLALSVRENIEAEHIHAALDRIFEDARASNAMLFFDEADALFGKRSAIKDAHDRYANIEVAYVITSAVCS